MSCSTRLRSHAIIAAVFVLVLPRLVWATDELPKFSDPAVNSFVQSYAQFVNDYIQAYQAAKTGNNSQFVQLQKRIEPLEKQIATITDKLKSNSGEVEKYEAFVSAYTKKMIDATSQ